MSLALAWDGALTLTLTLTCHPGSPAACRGEGPERPLSAASPVAWVVGVRVKIKYVF